LASVLTETSPNEVLTVKLWKTVICEVIGHCSCSQWQLQCLPKQPKVRNHSNTWSPCHKSLRSRQSNDCKY